MGNLESAVRNDCELLNCESGANEVHADPLLELLYWKITVWSTCPAPLWKSETASSRREKRVGTFEDLFQRLNATFMACFTVGEKAVKEISAARFGNPTGIVLTIV